MNERIRELAEQAKKYSIDKLDETGELHKYYDVYFEKFAELIIQECINKIETYQIPVGNSAAGEMACEWTYDALKQVRDEIKEYFGVEE